MSLGVAMKGGWNKLQSGHDIYWHFCYRQWASHILLVGLDNNPFQ